MVNWKYFSVTIRAVMIIANKFPATHKSWGRRDVTDLGWATECWLPSDGLIMAHSILILLVCVWMEVISITHTHTSSQTTCTWKFASINNNIVNENVEN